ncbi:hypothetical protein Agub_g6291 [Astrephomene gubernaculifera]|uniref:EF-hand domain-containing protein n=1 Tax=Astrephomene gubernaculifera TaxID=47775 RepID=A0AAD3DN74_9CHLO|nr:hypothetical protein Agub_g6291 [Astrephomene gubernaculifera]
MLEFDKDKDGQLSPEELGMVIEKLAAARSNRKVLMGVIIGFVIFSILLIGALSGMTWGVVAALKEEEIRGGKMYDIEDPTQVVQTANSDMSVIGGVLVNRQAYEATNDPDNSTALPGTGNTPHASTVLRTAAFVGTPQKFSSQIPVKSLMELKYLYIKGAGEVEVAMTVLGVARVPQAGSAHGTVVHILTLAGTITLDGTAIDFAENLAPVFVQAGFQVSANRRSLLGAYDILGFFNFIEDVDIFNMPSGEPRPALPSGDFRMQIKVFDMCAVPYNPTKDRCAYLPGSAIPPPMPPPATYHFHMPPPAGAPASDINDTTTTTGRRRLAETGERRHLLVTSDTTTSDGLDLAGTAIVNGTRYMVHTETTTYYKGLTRTVYEYAMFPDYVKVELYDNKTEVLNSWTQEVNATATTPATYFCRTKPHTVLGSLGNANESLVNFTFVGYEEHFGRSARHFKLVVKQPEPPSALKEKTKVPPLSSLLTIDYWDSRAGAIPLGFEFDHPWLGRTMINVTEFVQLSDSDINPKDFVYPLSVAGATCANDTSVPILKSPFALPSTFKVKNQTLDKIVQARMKAAGRSYSHLFNKTKTSSSSGRRRLSNGGNGGMREAYVLPPRDLISLSSSSASSAASLGFASNTSGAGFSHRRSLTDAVLTLPNQLDSKMACGAPAAFLNIFDMEPCKFEYAYVGQLYNYLYMMGSCEAELGEWPIVLEGSVTLNTCPSNFTLQGCISVSVSIDAYIKEYLEIDWLESLAKSFQLASPFSIEICVGWRPYDSLVYVSGELDIAMPWWKIALETELDFRTSRVSLEGITLTGDVGVNMYFWSYWIEVASFTFMEDYTIWQSSASSGGAAALAVATPVMHHTPASQYLVGCYGDYWNRRMNFLFSGSGMTVKACRQSAIANGYRYFGIEYAYECYGTNDMSTAIAFGQTNTCTMYCSDGLVCGGSWGLSIYDSGYIGCFTDNSTRMVPVLLARDASNANFDYCRQVAQVAGYNYYSMQGGWECWGTNDVLKAASLGASNACNEGCMMGNGDICGGAWANSLFQTIPNQNGTYFLYNKLNASSWVGCYADNPQAPVMTFINTAPVMTVTNCRTSAINWGFRFFAIQNGTICYGSSNYNEATLQGPSNACTLNCTNEGGSAYTYANACGSPITATSATTSGATAISIQDSGYLGCFKDSNITDLVPNLLKNDTIGMTPDNCRNSAINHGYDLYALQNGTLCFGASYSTGLTQAISMGLAWNCNVTCTGTTDFMCGGVYANSIYQVVIAPYSSTTGGFSNTTTTITAPNQPPSPPSPAPPRSTSG